MVAGHSTVVYHLSEYTNNLSFKSVRTMSSGETLVELEFYVPKILTATWIRIRWEFGYYVTSPTRLHNCQSCDRTIPCRVWFRLISPSGIYPTFLLSSYGLMDNGCRRARDSSSKTRSH